MGETEKRRLNKNKFNVGCKVGTIMSISIFLLLKNGGGGNRGTRKNWKIGKIGKLEKKLKKMENTGKTRKNGKGEKIGKKFKS